MHYLQVDIVFPCLSFLCLAIDMINILSTFHGIKKQCQIYRHCDCLRHFWIFGMTLVSMMILQSSGEKAAQPDRRLHTIVQRINGSASHCKSSHSFFWVHECVAPNILGEIYGLEWFLVFMSMKFSVPRFQVITSHHKSMSNTSSWIRISFDMGTVSSNPPMAQSSISSGGQGIYRPSI